MKKFVLAVFFDHSIEAGGNFQQSLNNIFLANRLISSEIDVKIITTKKENIKILNEYGLKSFLYSPNIFSRVLMRFKKPLLFWYIDYYVYFLKNHFEKFLEKKS